VLSSLDVNRKNKNTRLLYLSSDPLTISEEGRPTNEQKVFERLNAQAKFQQSKLEEQRKRAIESKFDPATGRDLFKPKINENAKLLQGRRNQPH